MREIKFRAWLKQEDGKFRELNPFRFIHMSHEGELYSDKDIIISQYTGLKDKNGKEIYEGDIVKVWDTNNSCGCEDEDDDDHFCDEMYICKQEIKFNCGWFCSEEIGDYCPPLNEDYLQMEVIGNIYENPELI